MSASAARSEPGAHGAPEPYTVLIADDDVNYRAALTAVIEHEPNLRLVAVARSAAEAVSLALERRPEVVLVDVRMAGGGGAHVARELTRAGSPARVIALSAYDNYATVMQMFDAGASGYLLKGSTVETLLDGIANAARGLRTNTRPPGRAHRPHNLRSVGDVELKQPIGVLLVDEDRPLLAEMSDVVAAEPGLELVGSATTAAEAIRLAILHKPQVALIDWRLPGGGVDLMSTIKERSPATSIVGISATHHPDVVMAMLRAGAAGFVAKPARQHELVAALRVAASGHMSLAPEFSGPVLEQLVVELQDRGRAADDRALMRERVRAAMHGPLTMAYQPIFALGEEEPVAYEALARFALEPRQMANVWFRDAARCGLVVELDLVTMTKALEALDWLPPDVALHINLAPETLFAGRATELLAVADPARVVVEITEHSDIEDYGHLNRALAPLREHGIRLAVDDVGAGFSSLRHVLVLEPDMIKLDISLCRGIDSNQVRRALARALTAFGHEVDKMVVAEGVETESELAALLELGVTHAQGHLLGRPNAAPV